jgi:hypothetical protein
MIKKFKIFEKSYFGDISDDLVDILSDDDIEEYYRKSNKISLKTILYEFSSEEDGIIPSMVKEYFNGSKYKEDRIKGIIGMTSINDFDKYDYKSFIESNLTDAKKEKILKFYNEENYYYFDDDDIKSEVVGVVKISELKNGDIKIKVTSSDRKSKIYEIPEDFHVLVENGESVEIDEILATGREMEYEDNMINELDNGKLIEVIDVDNEERKFIEERTYSYYDDQEPEDMVKDKCYDSRTHDYLKGKELIDTIIMEIESYVDGKRLKADYFRNIEFDSKKEYAKDNIIHSKFLQKKLLTKSAIFKLTKLLEENRNNHANFDVARGYKFQKLYIQEYLKKAIKKAALKEKPFNDEKALYKVLEYLDFNFNLNSKIEEDYKDNDYLLTKKYNL